MGGKAARTMPDALTEQASQWFTRLMAHDVSEAERVAFESWREADPAHADAFDRVRRTWSALGATAPSFLSGSTTLPSSRSSVSRRRIPLAIAASVTLAIIGGTVALFFIDTAAPVALVQTAKGERRTVTLGDGSTVQLNTGTRLRVSVTGAGSRHVELVSGEAFFDVAHDASRPFEVIAGGRAVRVTGTQFDVAYIDAQAEVAVLQGQVEVGAERGFLGRLIGADRGERVVLKPGQMVAYKPNAPMLPISQSGVAKAVAWREGHIVFERAPLTEVVRQLDRYFEGEIVLDDRAHKAAKLFVTLVLPVDDRQKTLELLETVLPIHIERNGPTAILTLR